MTIGPLETKITGRHEEDVVFQKRMGGSIGLGFSAAVLSLLPFGVSDTKQKETIHQYEIKKVEEQMFFPRSMYVQQSILQPEVLSHLAQHRY